MLSSRVALAVIVTSLVCGCGGGGESETAPVRGKVTCEGTPITSGMITFNPIAEGEKGPPGKAASGKINPDGTFELSTYKPGDGAIIGMHNVSYAPLVAGEGDDSDEEDEGGNKAAPPPPAAKTQPAGKGKLLPCQQGGIAKIGVVAGRNDLTIELSSWAPKVEDDEDRERGE